MSLSTITSKGQTTIPIEIRDFLQLNPGDKLEYIMQDSGHVLLVPATVDVVSLKGILRKPKRPVSLDAMQKAIRERRNA